MINWIVLAVLSGSPSNGDIIATWVHEDADARVAIRLDADGGCLIESTRQFNGRTYKELCGYSVTGSTVQIRTKGDATNGHMEFSLVLDPRTDQMSMGNEDGVKFYRARLRER
ncbi:MAG TPA: hypothetical protein VKR38_18275 [Usitatibacter sp.]|nr:hypothetical protein [Usitatibacter sp.]